MSEFLCISIRFLNPESAFHGQRNGGKPEWPPSPLRLFQALVNSSANLWKTSQFVEHAKPSLKWLEKLRPLLIIAPQHHVGLPYCIAVPNNDLDCPARVWSNGGEPKKPHRPNDLKTIKTLWPTRLIGTNQNSDLIHYIYPLPNGQCPFLNVLNLTARSITHLGKGIDIAVGEARVINDKQVTLLPGLRWWPSPVGGIPLRVTKTGTLEDLIRKHNDFLHRVDKSGFRPVGNLRVYDVAYYRDQEHLLQRPFRIFELRNSDESFFSYPQSKLIHISGMVRHLAIQKMKEFSPEGVPDNWVDSYVAGHNRSGDSNHKQFSYIPLSSIGHPHVLPAIRRIMIVAPFGDERFLEHLARRLDGERLEPTEESKISKPPMLIRVKNDNVASCYTNPSNTWASVTPVILPGHNDHKPGKTHKLILKAFAQSGIEQACEFEWSAISCFSKSMTAHKYNCDKDDPNKKTIKIWLPDYLQHLTAIHLKIQFKDDLKVPGPIVIGAGRHCGFGILAPPLNT